MERTHGTLFVVDFLRNPGAGSFQGNHVDLPWAKLSQIELPKIITSFSVNAVEFDLLPDYLTPSRRRLIFPNTFVNYSVSRFALHEILINQHRLHLDAYWVDVVRNHRIDSSYQPNISWQVSFSCYDMGPSAGKLRRICIPVWVCHKFPANVSSLLLFAWQDYGVESTHFRRVSFPSRKRNTQT